MSNQLNTIHSGLVDVKRPFTPSPQIADIPDGVKPRLIDKGLLHLEASLAGSSERYGRGITSHTIHVWWARRPHSAMRVVAFASLCKDITPETLSLMAKLSAQTKSENEILNEAKEIIGKQYKSRPRTLDMFGGGGTIPFEFAQLGTESYSLDSNQLSVFIQQCNLVYSQDIKDSSIVPLVKTSGQNVLKRLTELTEPVFPLRSTSPSPLGYVWTYLMECKACQYKYHLIKRPWLSKKKGRQVAFVLEHGENKELVSIQNVSSDFAHAPNWFGRNGTVKCPKCEQITTNIKIKDAADTVVAVVYSSPKRGKSFDVANMHCIPNETVLDQIEQDLLKKLQIKLPESQLPKWSGIVNPALYGVDTHSDFVNQRQRIVLLALLQALIEEYQLLKNTESLAVANYIISVLSSLIDQLVDWNCRFSMWIPQNEQVGRAFCGPGVSMYWDYIEIDPINNGPANLWDKLDRILAGITYAQKFEVVPNVQHGYAQSLPFHNDFFDAIVTDPPYYDNIYYSVLADFFYAWKRPLLQHLQSRLFDELQTDSSRELVASKFRSGGKNEAHEDYCFQLTQAMHEADRVLKKDGVFIFIYSHSSLRGWEAIVRAFRSTSFINTSVQPLSIERKQRPRAVTSEAVNTCIAFVMHKTSQLKQTLSLCSMLKDLEIICIDFANSLIFAGWNEMDTALAVYAHGVGMLINIDKIEDGVSDIEALKAMELMVKERFPEFQIKDRKSL